MFVVVLATETTIGVIWALEILLETDIDKAVAVTELLPTVKPELETVAVASVVVFPVTTNVEEFAVELIVALPILKLDCVNCEFVIELATDNVIAVVVVVVLLPIVKPVADNPTVGSVVVFPTTAKAEEL